MIYFSFSGFVFLFQIADKLCASFGQDILDSLFWTATEPRGKRREHFGVIPHLLLAIAYVCILFVAIVSQVIRGFVLSIMLLYSYYIILIILNVML